MEKIVVGHITVSMLIAFLLGIICIFLFAKMRLQGQTGYATGKFFKPTWWNFSFHLLSGVSILFLLHEISAAMLTNWLPFLEGNSTYYNSLSWFSGAGGGFAVAYVFEKIRKKFNTTDINIKHIHDEECEH